MKTLHTILFILMSFISIGQISTIDIESDISDSIFLKINEYRISKGLTAITESDTIREFAKNFITKSAEYPRENFGHSRSKYEECIAHGGSSLNWFVATSVEEALYLSFDNDIVNNVMDCWKKSKKHNKLILKRMDKAEGAVYLKIKVVKGKSCFPKGSNLYTVEFFATYDFYQVWSK